MLDMAQAGIAHIAAHTNLDAAPGGVNDTLMKLMGAQNVRGEGFVRAGELEEGMTFGMLCARAQQKLHAAVRAYGAADTPVHVWAAAPAQAEANWTTPWRWAQIAICTGRNPPSWKQAGCGGEAGRWCHRSGSFRNGKPRLRSACRRFTKRGGMRYNIT